MLPAEGSGDAAAKARGTSAGSEPHLFALPTVSLGITVQEPFLSLGELPLHLEQHFSFMAAEDFFPPEGSALAGFADFLVGVRATTLPLSASAGVALGASHLEFDGMDPIQGESVRFILAVMGLVRLELAEPFPGAVAVITRHGRLYESGTYRDLRLALELTL